MNLTGAEIIARTLKAHGVDVLFTLVGDHILPLCDRLPDHGIRIIDVRHDAAAVHMADAYGRAGGGTGVCATTGGPGLANSVAGLATAYLAESGLVHIAGAPETSTEGMGGVQEIDQIGLTAPVTKAAHAVRDVRRVSAAVAGALRRARAGRPGPVHLTIPLDVQSTEIDEAEAPIVGPASWAPPLAHPEQVSRAVAILQAARRPVVIGGATLRAGSDPESLRRFIERAGVPFFAVEQARGMLSDRHPLSLGYADPWLNDAGGRIPQADVVVLLGKRPDYRVAFGLPPFIAADAQVIQVDPDPAEIGRHGHIACGLVGDPGAVVRQLADAADLARWPDWSGWVAELRDARTAHRVRLEHEAQDDTASPVHPLQILRALRDAATDEAVFTFDVGDFGLWGRIFLPAHRMGRWHRPGSMGQLGSALPMAMGCKIALPDAPVACIMGDGGLGYHLMELDTAVRHNIPIVVVVGNDAGWGVDRHFQIAYYGRVVATDLRPLRYDRLASALDCHVEHVDHAGELPAAMRRAFTSGRPAMVHVTMRSAASPVAQAIIARHHQRAHGR